MNYFTYSKKQLRAAIRRSCSNGGTDAPVLLRQFTKPELARKAAQLELNRLDIEGPSQLNLARMTAADMAVYVHAEETSCLDEPADAKLIDLLTNLRHWADASGLDFAGLCEVSYSHFAVEQAEEKSQDWS